MAEFTFYWRSGQREVLEGDTPEDAANQAGYGAGAIRALDFWANGNDSDYEWRDGDWRKAKLVTMERAKL